MTVIAWDGNTLAADKQSLCGDSVGIVTKIFRHNGCLLGFSGDASMGMHLIDWFKHGARSKDWPPGNNEAGKGAALLVIHPDRTIWKYETSPYPFQLEGDHVALGTGIEVALGCMWLGASSLKAAQAACAVLSSCGGGIDTLKLDVSE